MLKPYLTKIEYIEALEQALQAAAQCETIEQARLIVSSVPQRGGRWRKASPLSHAELEKAARELGEDPGEPEAGLGKPRESSPACPPFRARG